MDALLLAMPNRYFVAKAVLGRANAPRHPQPGGERRSRTRLQQQRWDRAALGTSEGQGVPGVNGGTKLQGEKSRQEQTQRLSRGFH